MATGDKITVKREIDASGTDVVGLENASAEYVQALGLVDESIVPYGVKHIDNKPRVSSSPYLYDIAEGLISGHNPLHKFGANKDADSPNEETIWTGGGIYVYLSSASILKISSASAADTVPSGTGAKTVQIYGLDSSFNEQNETISLTGQTSVNTVNQYRRIFRMIIRSAGSTGSNEGIVYAGTGTVTAGVPATVYAQIEIGINQTQMALWTVPDGMSLFITSLNATENNNKRGVCRLYIRPENEVFQLKADLAVANSSSNREFSLPLKIDSRSDIEFRVLSDVLNSDITAAFDGWYE